MSSIIDNVLPIFALIAIGWVAGAAGLLKPAVGDALGEFVFRLAVPVLLFRTIVNADFAEASPWGLWLSYFTGVAVTWTAGHLIATRLFGRDRRIGVVAGVSSAFANNVFIGLPLVERILDARGMVALSILLSVHLPVMMIAGTLMMERAERREAGTPGQSVLAILRQVAVNLVRNPLVIGLTAGSLVHLAGIPVTGVPAAVMEQLANCAAPAALVSMGLGLRRYGISGNVGPALVMTALKLVALPATVLLVARLIGLDPVWTAALVLTASVPTGINAYLIASHFGVGHGLASSVITLTTALGAISVSIWALLLTG